MYVKQLAALPGILDDGRVANVGDLLRDVEFAEHVQALGFVFDRVQYAAVSLVHVLNVAQPVVDQSHLAAKKRGANAAAAVVAADHDVLDIEHFDRVLNHGQTVEVRVDDDVGDIAVHEQFARLKPHNFVGGNTAVGAADPQILRGLKRTQAFKIIRILLRAAVGPSAVVVE